MWEIFEHRNVRGRIRQLPDEIARRYEKWKDIVEFSSAAGLRLIWGFRDESLNGQWKGHRSSRFGNEYRVMYRIERKQLYVMIVDITAHDYQRS